MPITDYLQGINNYTSGQQQDVTTAAGNLADLQAGAGSLPSKLKEALNQKLNYNKDIINQQSDVMQQYFAAPSAARAKYQDVWNPFEREKLVAQERTMALKPYDTLTNVLSQRMGDVADITEAGVQGWQGMVDAAATQLSSAQTRLGSALQAYQIAGGQQEAADNLALAIANAKEASRQFNVAQELEREQFDEGVRQFNVSESNKLRIAGMGSGSGGSLTDKDKAANTKEMQNELREIIADPAQGLKAAWAYISGHESSLGLYGVNANDLWSIYTASGGSSTPVSSSGGGGFMSGLFGGSDYSGSQMNLSTGKVAAPATPTPKKSSYADTQMRYPSNNTNDRISNYLKRY